MRGKFSQQDYLSLLDKGGEVIGSILSDYPNPLTSQNDNGDNPLHHIIMAIGHITKARDLIEMNTEAV